MMTFPPPVAVRTLSPLSPVRRLTRPPITFSMLVIPPVPVAVPVAKLTSTGVRSKAE